MATLHQAQLNVETYFNESMDRVSGWYKRQAQIILIVIASALVLIFNVDSIAITNDLATDPTMRASVVALAEGYISETAGNSAGGTGELPLIDQLTDVIDQTGLPFGWRQGNETIIAWPVDAAAWIYKAIGLLITIVAVSQGAPFWFDTINKLINIRMAGKRPEDDRMTG